MHRTFATLCLALIGLASLAAVPAHAQSGSDRPIRLVVPFAPGGSTDLVARILAERLSKDLGRPMIVENRAGASGHLGSAQVAQAAPDGQTLLLNGTGPLTISTAAGMKLPYDPMTQLTPIAIVARLPNLVAVNAALPVKSIADLVAYAKANPGKLNYGMSAIGNLSHLNAEMFAQAAGITMTGIAYKGTNPMMIDLIGGTIQVSFDNLPPFVPHVRSGKLRALAVTSASRSALLPEVPSLTEVGFPGFDNAAQFSIFGPAGMSKDLVDRLSAAFTHAVGERDIAARLVEAGVEPAPGSAAQLGERMRAEREQFAKVIAAAGIKLE